MVGQGLWVFKPRFGKRGGRFGVVPALCVLIVSAALLALLFIDSIESWATYMNMNTMVEAQGGIIPPQSVLPTRRSTSLCPALMSASMPSPTSSPW